MSLETNDARFQEKRSGALSHIIRISDILPSYSEMYHLSCNFGELYPEHVRFKQVPILNRNADNERIESIGKRQMQGF
ncbi:MAG: hypothetical protein WA395_13055 [Nitrososphaeraceae archaeon]